MNGMASQNAPAWSLPVKHFTAGMVAWVVLVVLLAVRPQLLQEGFLLTPRMLALVHLTTLGWLTSVMMGALYQLMPVVLQVKFYSEQRGQQGFWFYAAGVALMVFAFWYNQLIVLAVGGLLTAGTLLLFVDNAVRTLSHARPFDIHGKFIAAGLVCLAFVALLGLSLIAAMLRLSFVSSSAGVLTHLGMHAVLGVGGWFGFTLIGVAYKLIPMFALVHNAPGKSANYVWLLTVSGLIGVVAALGAHAHSLITLTCFALLLGGFLLFALDLLLIYRRRLRRRPDLGLQASIIAVLLTLVSIVAIAGLVIVERLYWHGRGTWLFSSALGAISLLVLWGVFGGFVWGQLYKIIPFLTWLQRYSSLVGKQAIPMMQDLVQPEWDRWSFAAHFTGLLLIVLAVILPMQPGQLLLYPATLLMAVGGVGLACRLCTVLYRK